MPSKSMRFEWKDRDTAAHDLLQLAYYAPPYVSDRAISLLQAFRASSIVPDLVEIAMDEQRDVWERRHAIYAIASVPDEVYLPQLAPMIAVKGVFDFPLMLQLVSRHRRNLDWFFEALERLSQQEHFHMLCHLTDCYVEGESIGPTLCQRIMSSLDSFPELFDIKALETLYFRDGSEATLRWLHERWDQVIDLCLSSDIDDTFFVLKEWQELREAVFLKSPSFIETYDQKSSDVALRRSQYRPRPIEYQTSPIWQELHEFFQAALEGNQESYHKLARIVRFERKNLSKRAVATNLLGKLKQKYDVRGPLFHALRYGPDDPDYEDRAVNAAIRLEAGEALRDIVLPDVWETMVDSFFMRPRNVLEEFMSDWIEYLTDRLSGIDKPYSGMQLGDESYRFWFGALVEKSAKDA